VRVEKRSIPILLVFLAILACNTLVPELPQNPVPDAGVDIPRRTGECTDQRFKDAELAAYQTLVQEMKAATEVFNQKITQIEAEYKDRLYTQRSNYNKTLSACKDATCSEGAKQDYDRYVALTQVDEEAQRQIAEDAEQTAIEQAQINYNKAVNDAMGELCPRPYTVNMPYDDYKTSGVICSLALTFTLDITPPGYPIEFTPASATSGAWTYEWGDSVVGFNGSGTYTVSGLQSDSPQIVMSGIQTTWDPDMGTVTGIIEYSINLAELSTNECK